jgi:hypothetical protein
MSFESAEKPRRQRSLSRAMPLLDALASAYNRRVAYGLMNLIKYQLEVQKAQKLRKIETKFRIK